MGQYLKVHVKGGVAMIEDTIKEELIERLYECLSYMESTGASDYLLLQVNKTIAKANGHPFNDDGSGAV